MKSIVTLSFVLLINLCFCQEPDIELLSEIQAYPQSTLCIGYDQVTLIDSFPESRMYRSYFVDENDSMRLGNRTKLKFDNPQSEGFFNRFEFLECFNSIGLANYKYDSLNAIKQEVIPENNTIIHFKEYLNTKYFITKDTSKWCFNIIIAHEDGMSMNTLGNMDDGLLFADFMLFDFTGDITPEIFVIKHVLIGSSELAYLQVYSVLEE